MQLLEHQVPPKGFVDGSVKGWLMLAGRGVGKTCVVTAWDGQELELQDFGVDRLIIRDPGVGRYAVDRYACEMLTELGYEWVVFQDSDDIRRAGALDLLWDNKVKGGVVVGAVEWHYLDGRRRTIKASTARRGFRYRWHYGAALWDLEVVRPFLSMDYRISWDMVVAWKAVNSVPVKVLDDVVYDWWEREGSLTRSPATGMASVERKRVNAELAAMMR